MDEDTETTDGLEQDQPTSRPSILAGLKAKFDALTQDQVRAIPARFLVTDTPEGDLRVFEEFNKEEGSGGIMDPIYFWTTARPKTFLLSSYLAKMRVFRRQSQEGKVLLIEGANNCGQQKRSGPTDLCIRP